MLQFRFAGVSETGPVRDHNEDAGFVGPYLLCVADGVGGAAAGEVASATTAYVVSARSMLAPGMNPVAVLRGAIADAHDQIAAGVAADPGRTGMATTVTAVLTDGERVGVAHVGDSRGYLLHEGRLRPITRDHTLIAALVGAGRITPEEAAASPYRHVVMQAVDADHVPDPDLIWLDVVPGDRLLLCSDGLTDVIDDAAIELILRLPSPRLAATRLVTAAIDAGSRDNVTCLVADVVDAPPVVGNGIPVGAAVDMRLVVDPTAVRPLRSA